jgi:hypothetical protein
LVVCSTGNASDWDIATVSGGPGLTPMPNRSID